MNPRGNATVEDLLNLPEDGRKYELVGGEIVVSPTGYRHSRITIKIVHIIATFLDQHPVGVVCGSAWEFGFPAATCVLPMSHLFVMKRYRREKPL